MRHFHFTAVEQEDEHAVEEDDEYSVDDNGKYAVRAELHTDCAGCDDGWTQCTESGSLEVCFSATDLRTTLYAD